MAGLQITVEDIGGSLIKRQAGTVALDAHNPMCKAVRVEPGKSLHIPLRLHLDWEHMEESSYR